MHQAKVPFCCVCGKVQDVVDARDDQGPWIELRAFKMKQGYRATDFSLVQAYCPDCRELFEKVTRQKARSP